MQCLKSFTSFKTHENTDEVRTGNKSRTKCLKEYQ